MEHDDEQSPVIGRRELLRSAGAWSLVGLAGVGSARAATRILRADELDVSDLLADPRFQASCVLTPGQIQGPYYLNLNLVRSDITEGKPGQRTKLWIHVVRASDCSPVPNATVDLWHADALGIYSGIAAQGTVGQTFLRGVQFTDANGTVSFDSIFPGWYPGRTTHLHVKVKPLPTQTLTTQLYFTQGLNNRVHGRPPYSAQAGTPTTNSQDGFFLPETVMSVLGLQQGVLQLELTIAIA